MKKLMATAPDKVEVVDVEMPEMGEDEILVRGVRSLLSPGSELKRVRRSEAYPGPWPNPDLGYAMAGVVEETGSRVEVLKPGDRVVTMRHHQQYVVASGGLFGERPAMRVPDSVDWDTAPFGIWGRSCINWSRRAAIVHGETVAVVGCGLVGLLMVMWAKLSNPRRVIAIDLVPKRLELARRAGADFVLNPRDGDIAAQVRELSEDGADVTLHCVGGAAAKSFDTSQVVTRRGGRVVLIGHHWTDLRILPHGFTNIDLLGSGVGYDRDPKLFVDGMELLQAGKLPVADIVTHKVPYTDGPGIYDMLISNPDDSGAILLEWDT